MFDFIVLSPPGPPDAALAIAGSRAGAIGVLDLEFAADRRSALDEAARVSEFGRGRWGVQLDDEELLASVLGDKADGLEAVLVASTAGDRLGRLVELAHSAGRKAYTVATSLEEALAAEAGGADAVIAKGHEAGGWIGDEGSFVLLQRLLMGVRLPVWTQGGIGLHTVGAAYVAGAAGVVLDGQLLLSRESPLPDSIRSGIASMDGSETATLGSDVGAPFRLYSRPGLRGLDDLRETAAKLGAAADARDAWRTALRRRVAEGGVLPIGQDGSFAADLAHRFVTVGGIVGGLRAAVADAASGQENPLAKGAPLAESHGTRYPLVQGPMTRVSDRAEFAAAVAEAGALPFLALALMRAPEVDDLLEGTAGLLGDRPWGVGILGFVPPELRAEQLEVVHKHRPRFALIAGGRPDQARALEDEGIATYLHVPSPGLLKLYLADGARRFVFEGRECGGHVGPRTSFVLWDTMLRALVEELAGTPSDCHVLLAGGIHDARSAAMAAAAAAPAAQRGIRIGALLGTAYLYTREAVDHGAITPRFQEAAMAARGTVLLESGPGHATRCAPSPFVEQFEAEKRRLRADGVAADELRGRLEQLNIGRLRIASKGADRDPGYGKDRGAAKLVGVAPSEQWQRGMYMIGQVAALRDRITTLAELHREVSDGSTEILRSVQAPEAAPAPAPAPADIAIVGLGCILPGAADVATFWANILDKVDAIGEVPPERWDWRRYYDSDPSAPDKVYSRWGGFIEDVPFDPVAFGLPPKSLGSIEPFQLLALITAQAALRDAGYDARPFDRERTSVMLGAGGGGADLAVGYTVRSALPALLGDAVPEQLWERLPEWTEDSFAGLLMNVAAGRIANRLDLGGANYTVDAACASSLAAVGLAARELQLGTSDMALAGGVDAIQNPFAYLCFSKTHALSPNGRCRPFDAAADGIAISEGFATVVLKRLADAEHDGDRVYAVIRGVGAASDGRDRSLTAPRPEGQVRALRRAYAQARISPASVELVEAHGTGTVAGDGAEVQALSTLFGEEGDGRQWCAIGSVKSMIGHTKATAGVAGLVKAALALHHRVLPPTIGVTEPNPKAGFAESPFYVNTEARPWLGGGAAPRRAGVSAFGFGGTDFHVVLEEYTGRYVADRPSAVDRRPAELLLWRGSKAEIRDALGSLADRLAAGAEPRLPDLARTLGLEQSAPQDGRTTLALVAESLGDLHAKLGEARDLLTGDARRLHTPRGIHWAEHPLAANGHVAFLFPGQGSQAVDMGRELALAFPESRECFEQADRVLAGDYDRPLSRFIFPPPSFTPEEQQSRQAELTETHVAQAALGATELAYLRVLELLGVRPELAAGHSYGEFVALAAAGCLADNDLLRLSEARGRFMGEAAAGSAGAMAAVDSASGALEPLLEQGELVAANLNAPEQTVLSGPRERVEAAVEWCRERGIRSRVLPVACAFHSPHVGPAQRRLAELLERTPVAPPRIPLFSNTTGDAHAEDPAAIRGVLSEHLVRPVDFIREVEAMYRDGARLFVEVGPRAVLSGLVGQILGEREHLAVPVDRPGQPGLVQLLHCLAALAAEGVPVEAEGLFRGRSAERIDLAAIARDGPANGHAAGSWLVNGGGARPADAAAEEPAPIVTRPEEQSAVATSTNGGGSLVPAAAPDLPAAIPAMPPAGDRASDVMSRYQRVMQQFLETQSAVMLAYLGAPRPAGVARPAPAMRVPAAEQRTPVPTPVAQPELTPAQAAPEPEPVGNGQAIVTREQIEQRLLSVVSERTGYPTEMLGLDADLEGDLGIDSIKRVEIAGTLTQTLTLPGDAAPDVEQLTASRTLREVIDTLAAAVVPPPDAAVAASGEQRPFDDGPAEEERIGRFVVQAASAPAIDASAGLAKHGVVVIVDDGSGVGAALADALEGRSQRHVLLDAASTPESPEQAAGLAERLREECGGANAVVWLTSDAGPATLLLLVQALRGQLEAAAAEGGAAVLAATRLGGAFGVEDPTPEGAAQGAIPGFLKTLALEWPSVRVKAVDLAPGAPPELAGEQLLAELGAADDLVEVGYRDGARTQLTLAPAPLEDRAESEPISNDSVVLVTGGGRGITAEVALSIASRYQPMLILVGRTPPGEEEPETAAISDLVDLRPALIEARRRAGAELTPALVEADCRRLLRGRELRDNLSRLRGTGARVEYLTCDVSDADSFGALIDELYERHGRIDGVIHGAGVIEDRLVRDKHRDSLERVMETKAGAALTLARKLRPEELRFLVLFSSVSGRFGNRGQADYAAASEVLGRLAHQLDRRWPARVVSIAWGPWRAPGMVSPELEREFARRGVALIPVDQGCRMLEQELRRGSKGEPEVVIGAAAGLSGPEETAAIDPARLPLLSGSELSHVPDGGIEALRSLDVGHDRYLDDHRVDGQPVLPFAVAMELMAEAAVLASPGRDLTGLREVHLLHGVTVDDQDGASVRVAAAPREPDEVQVTIAAGDGDRRHYSAVVELGEPGGEESTPAPLEALAPFPMSVDDAYRELLFHGPLFQRIEAIEGMDERGAATLLRPSLPGPCVVGADGLEWLLDPVLLDSALQVQVIWARLEWDVTLLPAQIGSYRRVLPPASAGGQLVRHEMRVRSGSRPPLCHADHLFRRADGRLLATLGDVVGVGTQALNRLAAAHA